jgi:hypothetical protein
MRRSILNLSLILLLVSGCKNDGPTPPTTQVVTSSISSAMVSNAQIKISVVSSSLSKTKLTAGEIQTATVKLISATNISNLIVDLRIYNSAGVQIIRKPFENVKFTAGKVATFSFDYKSIASLPAGSYNIQVGVWNSSWFTYLYETRDVFSVVAASAPVPMPAPVPVPVTLPTRISIVSSAISKPILTPGEIQTATVKLTSATSVSNLIVDIRIYNSSNVQVVRKGFGDVSFAAGTTQTFTFDYQTLASLPAGTYNIQVGVWNSTWLTYLYETRDTFTVGKAVIAVSPPVPAPVPAPVPKPAPTPAPTPLPPVKGTGNSIYLPSSAVSYSALQAGQVQTANISVYSPTAQDLIVGIKFCDQNGNFLLETSMNSTFTAGQTKLFKVDYALSGAAPAGAYSMAVGVYNPDYSKTFLYESGLAKYQVTAIAQPVVATPGPMPANNLSMITGVDAYVYAGPYFAQNNMWGITGIAPGTFWETTGIGPLTTNKSVSARWQWSYPSGPNEVKGYPAIGFGKKPGAAATPGSNLPKLVDSIMSSICSWDTQSVYTGKGQLTFDLWLVRDAQNYPNFPQTPITHEIMLTVDSFGGYGVTRNPAWYFGATIIDGVTYRVWKADNFGGGGMSWRFIVLQMVNPAKLTKGSIDFKHVFNYLKSAGLISGQEYLSSIEFGNEMEEGTGDTLIKDFKAEIL